MKSLLAREPLFPGANLSGCKPEPRFLGQKSAAFFGVWERGESSLSALPRVFPLSVFHRATLLGQVIPPLLNGFLLRNHIENKLKSHKTTTTTVVRLWG